jgi:hypothetical protein
MGYERPHTGAERVAKRRAALRAQGLRPKTVWVPDTRTPEFTEQAQKACEKLWELFSDEAGMIAFAEAMTDEVLADLPLPWNDDE